FDVQNDSLLFALQSARSTDTIIWGLSGALSSQTLNFRLRLQPNLYINGQQWQLSPDNLVSYSLDGPWQMAQWELSKEREFISLQAVVHSKDSSQAVLAFRDFSISGLSPLLDYPPDYLAGTLNGRAELRDFLTNLNYVADLRLDKWTMDSLVIGNLELRAEQESRNSDILFVTQLADYGNQLGAQGRYQVQDRLLDAEAVIERMEMQSVDKFLPGLIHDSEGFVAGKFRLEGPVDQPKLQGQLQLKEVKTVIDYIKTKYQIEKGSIQITENKIDFGRIQMLDPNNRPALLSGQVNHNFFKDLTADLRFQTDQFQFLNTKSDDNDLFYGQLMLQSDVSIQGPLDQARLVINAKTQPGTDLYVVPLTDKQAIAREDFIIYGQPALDSLGRDTSNLYEQQMGSTGIDLQLNLETTSDASLQIIVDPLSGDQLICKGVSNLTVDVNPGGDVAINGTYQITEGRYSFSYEQLVKRQFDILPNSKITFDGDPLKAGIDITAAYKTRVPIRDLIENQLDIESLANSNQRIDIQVQLKIKGDLIQPELSFDIVLLNDPQGTLADAARNRLAELRTNQTDLSTQVFGLLLFNNFINVQNTGQNLNNAGGNALLSSVSRLISSQLNRLAGKIIKGVDVNVGVDAYQGSTDQVATEVQFGLSKRLFNDRLNVKVGGNLQLSEEQTGDAEPGTFTTFTGDFALEYRLKPDGNYLLRVYRRSDYDALNEGTVSRSGAGISLRKSLKNKKRKRKAK
ncbi:MAG: translocation/assembly module TamB domain-containing protein, partial [Bacteroidota bacterium]